jgi:hypothetical protein
MCNGCWRSYGSPRIVNAGVLACAELWAAEDEFGDYHIVVSDWNIDKKSIRYCLRNSGRKAFGEAMLALSLEERASAGAIANGYVESIAAQESKP